MYWVTGVLGVAITLYIFGFSPIDLYVFNSFGPWFVFFALGVSSSVWVPRIGTGRGLTLVFVAVVFLAGQWVFHESLGLRADSSATFARLLLALVGIAFVMAWSQWLMGFKWSWLTYLGCHSMEIYLVHIIAGSGIRVILHKFLGVTDVGIHLVFGLLGGIGMPLLLVIFARRAGLGWLFHPPRFLRLGARMGSASN